MYKHLFLLAAILLGTLSIDAQPMGWATIDGGTDGGRGENAVVVTTYKELVRALGKRDSTYRTIYIKGLIEFPGMLRVKDVSNKSIIGLPGSALVNDRYTLDKDSSGILRLDRCKNFIIQNITFLGPGAFDRDANDNLCVSQSEHIWVDHCDFQDGMDGNFDCNSGSDLITVSYCRFRYLKAPWPKLADDTNDDHNSDHRFSSLWGSSDREGMISGGRLRTTFYRCWWDDGCRARMPFVRFGKMHMLNCLYSSNVAKVYIQARYRSNVFVEACSFVNKPKELKLFEIPSSSKPAFQDYNLRFRNCVGADDRELRAGEEPYFEPPYPYEAISASEAETIVRQSAGATLSITEPSV